jgi:hypothetical protein
MEYLLCGARAISSETGEPSYEREVRQRQKKSKQIYE